MLPTGSSSTRSRPIGQTLRRRASPTWASSSTGAGSTRRRAPRSRRPSSPRRSRRSTRRAARAPDRAASLSAPSHPPARRLVRSGTRTRAPPCGACTGGVDSAVGLGYHDKGWPSFEYRLAMMIKVSNDSAASDWPQVLDLGKQGDAQWKHLARAAPRSRSPSSQATSTAEEKYTNGADRDKIVAPKCARPAPPPTAALCALCVRGAPHSSRCAACAGFGRRPLSSWAA